MTKKSLERIKSKIANAIERSESHNEIVFLKIDNGWLDALSAINKLTDCETDYVLTEHRGNPQMEVWGIDEHEDAEEGDMLWRLNISFAKT